jgi:hypothetical protein
LCCPRNYRPINHKHGLPFAQAIFRTFQAWVQKAERTQVYTSWVPRYTHLGYPGTHISGTQVHTSWVPRYIFGTQVHTSWVPGSSSVLRYTHLGYPGTHILGTQVHLRYSGTNILGTQVHLRYSDTHILGTQVHTSWVPRYTHLGYQRLLKQRH